MHYEEMYSGTPLVRRPLLYQKRCGQLSGPTPIVLCLDLPCQVAFQEGFVFGQRDFSKGIPLYKPLLCIYVFERNSFGGNSHPK